jgi:tetratricopeptide (TPR) repeat protein
VSTLNASVLNSISQEAMLALYDFRFHHADSLIQNMEETFPDHYLPHLTRANYYWWKIISEDSGSNQQQLYVSSLYIAENFVKEWASSKQYEYADVFHFINLYALKARLDLINGEYTKALRHMKSCVDYIGLSLGREELHENFYLTSGLYNYMSEYGSRRYPFLRLYALMYPKGNMKLGINQLEVAARSLDPVLQTEARYFLMKIFLDLEQDYQKALEHAGWLTGKYPGNLIYLYYYYELLSLSNQEAEADAIRKLYFKRIQSNTNLNSGQRNYLEGLL